MNHSLLLSLPVILPLVAAGLLLVLRRHPSAQAAGLIIATAANLGAALILFFHVHSEGPASLHFGGWEAPVGIDFRADLLSAILVLVAGLITFAGALFAMGEIGRALWRKNYAFFYLFLLTGINGAFLTGDLFNLFVWFEVMLMASFAMMVLGRRKFTLGGSTKYVVINVVSSFFFLSALGILYGKAGSLNLTDVAQRLSDSNSDPLILTSAALLLLAFGIKAGVFPLFF